MVRRFSISISDWVFNTYLKDEENNRSALIEGLIVEGAEARLKGKTSEKSKVLALKEELDKERQNNKRLQGTINRLKAGKKEKKPIRVDILE